MFSIHYEALSNQPVVRALASRSRLPSVPLLILAHIYLVPVPKRMRNLLLKLSGDKIHPTVSKLTDNLFHDKTNLLAQTTLKDRPKEIQTAYFDYLGILFL